MAIADKLTKLATDITNAYDAIDDKGGTLPSDKNTDNLENAIRSIETGITPTGTLEEDYAKFVQDDGDGNDVVCYIYKPDLEEGDLEDIEHIFDSNSSLVETLLEIAESGADDIEDVITAIDVSTMQDIISLTDIVYNLYLYRDTLIKIIIEATSETTLDIYNMTVAYEPYEVTVALEEDVAIGETTVVIGYVTKLIIPTGTTQITENGTYDVREFESAEINVVGDYNAKFNLSSVLINGSCYTGITELPEIDCSNRTSINYMFNNMSGLKRVKLINTSNVTSMIALFQFCEDLEEVNLFDTSNVTNFGSMFFSAKSIKEIPNFNTINATDFNRLCNGCTLLEKVPILDTHLVTSFQWAFYGCNNLTNESLNNILYMLAHATSYTGQKTLQYVGLSQTQATTCTTLSNWQAFVSAGWTTGY